MQENPTQDPVRNLDVLEREIVYLLTEPNRYPTIWSVADIGREIETYDPDALIRPLRNAGLVHRTTDDFVFATAAAFYLVALVGQIV